MNHFCDAIKPGEIVTYRAEGKYLKGTFQGTKIDITNGQRFAMISADGHEPIGVSIESLAIPRFHYLGISGYWINGKIDITAEETPSTAIPLGSLSIAKGI